MKKGQLIHTDNLILRIIVTFLGTFGAASIIETITYPLADMGFIGFVSLIFSVVYTLMLSCYGKNARLIRIMGMAVLPVVYLVINIGSFINGITTFINVFISRASFTGPVDSSNVLTVESAGAASVRCVCVVVVMIIAVLAALEVNVFPNMLVSLAITMPLLSVFIAAVIVPDIISIIFCVLFIFDSMALRNKKIKTNQGAKTAVIISAMYTQESLIQCLISELPMPRYLWEGISRITAGSDGRIQGKLSILMRVLCPSLHLIL